MKVERISDFLWSVQDLVNELNEFNKEKQVELGYSKLVRESRISACGIKLYGVKEEVGNEVDTLQKLEDEKLKELFEKYFNGQIKYEKN